HRQSSSVVPGSQPQTCDKRSKFAGHCRFPRKSSHSVSRVRLRLRSLVVLTAARQSHALAGRWEDGHWDDGHWELVPIRLDDRQRRKALLRQQRVWLAPPAGIEPATPALGERLMTC